MRIAGSQWFACPNAVFELGLDVRQGFVLVYLYRMAGPDGASWPSYVTIADACGLSYMSVRRAIGGLLKRGMVTKEERIQPGRGQTSNIYRLTQVFSQNTPPALPEQGGGTHRTGGLLTESSHEVPLSEVPPTEVTSASAPTRSASPPVQWSEVNFVIADTLLTLWKEAYPALDVEGEIRRAHAWTLANPKNRKKNWHRFVVNWLDRSQERAPRATVAPARPVEQGQQYPPPPEMPEIPEEQRAANLIRLREMVRSLAGAKGVQADRSA